MFWLGGLCGFMIGLGVGVLVTHYVLQKQFDDMGDYHNQGPGF